MLLNSSADRCDRLPLPPEAMCSWPGRALAWAMNSRTLPTGRLALTTSTLGAVATRVIGAKSFSVS